MGDQTGEENAAFICGGGLGFWWFVLGWCDSPCVSHWEYLGCFVVVTNRYFSVYFSLFSATVGWVF